jgi:excisionase family DNA binding protein
LTPEYIELVLLVVTFVVGAAVSKREPRRARAGLLTLEEVAAVCHVSPETVRHWIWEGRLTAYKPGRHPLVKESELLAFVEANETTKKRAANSVAKSANESEA